MQRGERFHLLICDLTIENGMGGVETMRGLKNPTRWCSVGCMTAAARLAKPSAIELIDYRQAVDEQGNALVSSASMAMLA